MIEFLSLTPLWALLFVPLLGIAFFFSLVDRPLWFRWASFLCRVLAVILLVLALCRPFWVRKSDDTHLVFLLDTSESVSTEAMREAFKLTSEAIESLPRGDSYSIYQFAKTPQPTTLPELEAFIAESEALRSDADYRSASDLASALSQVRLAFPANKALRIVLFSDGAVTGDIARAKDELQREKTDLHWHQLPARNSPEAAVESIEPLSPVAYEGELVRLRVNVRANQKMEANLRILHRGVAVAEKGITLPANEIVSENVDVEMTTSGRGVWQAELVPAKDTYTINNQAATSITVQGRPRVLVIHEESEKMRGIARSLREQGVELDLRGSRGMPDSLRGLLAFDAIVLADVPATTLRPQQMQWLKDYVTKFGGGLVMLGSENSYGLGGYYRTPVEEVLPLISRFEKEKEKPSLAMVLVIDKSGSMGGEPIVMARQAALATAELLSGRDEIAVLGFDHQPQLICPLTSASQQSEIAGAIESLQASGGTDLQPAMVQAREILERTSAKIRHIIAMTDGQTDASNLVELSQELGDQGITVSTVALGSGAAGQLLNEMAEAGRGRYYEAAEAQEVPQIFTSETMQASRSAIKEDLFLSAPVVDHPVMSGFENAEFPFILGYVMTRSKPTAQVLLATETGDPLLAIGRFGLGQGVAFTADLTERWGGEWLTWEGCGSFWAQLLRGILKKEDSFGLATTGQINNEIWELDIHRSDETGRPLNDVQWDAQIFDTDGKPQDLIIEEIGLGRYRTSIPLEDAERLSIRLSDPIAGKSKTLQWEAPYPPEYRLQTTSPEALTKTTRYDATKLHENLLPVKVRRTATPLFVTLALLLILAGLLLRRL